MNLPVPCIICGKELEAVSPEAQSNQPYGATTFSSYGQYGSTVFDPMGGGLFLEINICDEDVQKAAEASRVLLGQQKRAVLPRATYEVFDPYEPDGED